VRLPSQIPELDAHRPYRLCARGGGTGISRAVTTGISRDLVAVALLKGIDKHAKSAEKQKVGESVQPTAGQARAGAARRRRRCRQVQVVATGV
jgi:hypothetical protein